MTTKQTPATTHPHTVRFADWAEFETVLKATDAGMDCGDHSKAALYMSLEDRAPCGFVVFVGSEKFVGPADR